MMTMERQLLTKGYGDLGRIYERLRKRSYRRNSWHPSALIDHRFYLDGVRDALQAVADEMSKADPDGLA